MSINENFKKNYFVTARSRTLNSFLQINGILKADQWKEVQNDEFSVKDTKTYEYTPFWWKGLLESGWLDVWERGDVGTALRSTGYSFLECDFA